MPPTSSPHICCKMLNINCIVIPVDLFDARLDLCKVTIYEFAT